MKNRRISYFIASRTLPWLIAIIVISTVLLLFFAKIIIENQLDSRHQQIIQHFSENIENSFNSIRQQVANISDNELIVNSLIDPQNRESYIPLFIRSFSLTNIDEAYIAVTNFKGNLISDNGGKIISDIFLSDDWHSSVFNESKPYFSFNNRGLIIVYPIVFSDSAEGAVFFWAPLERLNKLFAIDLLDGSIFYTDENNIVLYSSDSSVFPVGSLYSSEKISSWFVFSRDEAGGHKIVSAEKVSSAYEKIYLLMLFVLASIFIAVVGSSVCVIFSSKLISKVLSRFIKTLYDIQDNKDQAILTNKINNSCDPEEFVDIQNKFLAIASDLYETKIIKNSVQSIFNSLSEYLVVFDVAGNTKMTNHAFDVFFSSVSGNDQSVFDAIIPADFRQNAVSKSDITEYFECSYDINNVFSSNWESPSRIIHWSRSVYLNNISEVDGIIFIGTDVTDRVNADKELKAAHAKAEESAKLKSEFLASMSHEIRTPMNGVLGMLGLLKNTALTSQQLHYTGLAQSSAESLLTLINDILDFSKVEAGKMELECIDFHLNNMLGDFVEAMAPRAEDKNIELILDVAGINTNFVKGDPGRLRQILTNLVGNAIKFTEKGEVVVRAALKPSKSGRLIFSCTVHDTGIGIPEDKLAHLFDSFSQVDASTTRKYGGTGLGLAIVRQLCGLMEGNISVVSTLGTGSKFSFTILLEPSKQSVAVMPNVDITGARILVVDDNSTIRDVLSSQLTHWGADVTQAVGGRDALFKLKNSSDKNFAIALIDMQMPDMDGEQLGRLIRADKRFDEIRLVMMTSISQRGDAKRFAKVGYSAFFPKPATTNDLFSALQVLLDNGEALSSASPLLTRHHLHSLAAPVVEQSLSSLATKRLLLVEDNVINQEVALGVLGSLGLTADVAGNGVEALAALRAAPQHAPYDLILMDCHMPEMDGYETTTAIRQSDTAYRAITIVAMTANAMKGAKEECFAVGMDDYISKPIEPDILAQRLQYWLGSTEENSADFIEESKPMNDNSPVWDQEGFMRRIMNNETIAVKLIDLFKSETPKTIHQLEQAIIDDQVKEAGLLAHKLKGSVSNLGGIELASLAQKIEHAGKAANMAEVKALWPDIQPQYDKLLSRIESRY